ncbi:MAG: cytochrome P450 [Myxococcota bacterium]
MSRPSARGSRIDGEAASGGEAAPARGGERITALAWDVGDPQFLTDPADYYRFLRDEAPVHRHAGSGAWLLSRFEDVWGATADWETYSSASPVAKLLHMASMDPPRHDRLRASVSRFFAPARIASLAPRVRAIADGLLDGLDARLGRGETVDLVEDFAAIFPSRVIHRLLGVAPALDEPIRAAALAVGGARDAEALAARMQAFVEATRRPEAVATDAHAGLLGALAAETGPEALSPEERGGVFSNLVLAGTDTVTNLIGNGLVLLDRAPEARARLVAEPARIPAAIEEMLRFESPVQSLARRTKRDVVLHGVRMAAGEEVRLLWGAANRDEREFPAPDVFDVDRPIRRHLAFGHGIHFCLGAGLARLEARIAFEGILARWPDYRVERERLARLPSLWVRAWRGVPIRLR